MSQTNANIQNIQNGQVVEQTDQAVQVVTVSQLIDELVAMSGNQFASIKTKFNMLETNAKGLKKMNKRGNPFLDGELIKTASTTVMVSFDYEKAVEKRTDGEETAKGGNWQQAVIVDGHLTPLSIHKGDIETTPKDGAEPRKDGSYAFADLQAVMDDNGNIIITANNPRAYLRCEYRGSKADFTFNGEPIEKSKVEPHLKKQQPTGAVDFHTVSLGNVTEMKINGQVFRL